MEGVNGMKRLSVALGLALCVALQASAQMYKWVDSDGTIKYSDTPPPSNVKAEKLRVPASPAARAPAAKGENAAAPKEAAKAAPMTAAEQERAFRQRRLEAAKAQEEETRKQAAERDKAENCKRANAALANLMIGGRQVRIDDKGERVFLDDDQIAKETARAREEAAAMCN
jgi:hypothetical protein